MAQPLNTISSAVEWRLMQKGSRLFALLGKATPAGITAFGREDIGRSWAVTAEFGCIRLEKLYGDEDVTGLELFLPTPFSYEYGITGISGATELTRAIFGLLPSELEELVSVLRRGSFPVLGLSGNDIECSITSCIIPRGWPHLVVSNLPMYGNIVSFEAFVRIVVSSLPNGQLGIRFPGLVEVAKEILKLMGSDRPGIPYHKEMVDVAPPGLVVIK
jgi:hypothetical protein